MQLNDASNENIRHFIKDIYAHPNGFISMMLPGAKVTMPRYSSVAIAMADNARATFIKQGSTITPDEIYALVGGAWMESLRLLELAALDGKRVSDSEILMQDPVMDTLEIPLLQAIVETKLVLAKIRDHTKRKHK